MSQITKKTIKQREIKHPLACVQSELQHPHHHCCPDDGLEGTLEGTNGYAPPAC
jgi:hypothetical protein